MSNKAPWRLMLSIECVMKPTHMIDLILILEVWRLFHTDRFNVHVEMHDLHLLDKLHNYVQEQTVIIIIIAANLMTNGSL